MKKQLLSLLFAAFTFGAANAQNVILSEDFEGGALPAGWNIVTSATDGGYNFGISTALESQYFPMAAHSIFAATNDDNCDCDKSNDQLISSAFDLSGLTSATLSFDYYFFQGSFNGITEDASVLVSTDGGTTWATAVTLPANTNLGLWETYIVDLAPYVGNANVKVAFKYNDGGDWLYGLCIDNVSIFSVTNGLDLASTGGLFAKLDPRPAMVQVSRVLANTDATLYCTVFNTGTTAITSYDIAWSDGVNSGNQSITGVNIPSLGTDMQFFSVPLTIPGGNNSYSVTVSNVNGGTDLDPSNDGGTVDIEGVTPNPDRGFFAEEATGTWCQWCPRGAVFMDFMHDTYGDAFVGVAVHNADPMVVTAYDAGLGNLISGYPSCVPNRAAEIDPSELENAFLDLIDEAPMVNIGGTATVNATSNALNVDLSATFTMAMSGDYRFMAVLCEDSVTGTTAQYNQSNAYGNNANGPMGGFEAFGTSVPAASMNYNHVNRLLFGTFDGQSGSIPGSVAMGTPYNYSFTGTATASWDKTQMYVAVVVLDGSTGGVLNAKRLPVTIVTGIEEANNAFAGSYVWPTATSDNINLMLNLKNSNEVMINVTDITGKVVMTQNLGAMNAGQNKMTWNVSNLAAGMYNVTATSAEGQTSMKFVKN